MSANPWFKVGLFAGLTFLAAQAALASEPQIKIGQAAFSAKCAMCHSVKPGENRIGPSLAAVTKRKMGTAPGGNYSPVLTSKNTKWTSASLDEFLRAPQEFAPGNRMGFPGEPDDAERAALVAYLQSLK